MITVKEAKQMFNIKWTILDKDDLQLKILIDGTKICKQEDFDIFMYVFRKELGEVYFDCK